MQQKNLRSVHSVNMCYCTMEIWYRLRTEDNFRLIYADRGPAEGLRVSSFSATGRNEILGSDGISLWPNVFLWLLWSGWETLSMMASNLDSIILSDTDFTGLDNQFVSLLASAIPDLLPQLPQTQNIPVSGFIVSEVWWWVQGKTYDSLTQEFSLWEKRWMWVNHVK